MVVDAGITVVGVQKSRILIRVYKGQRVARDVGIYKLSARWDIS
jgi:hypothetical protein